MREVKGQEPMIFTGNANRLLAEEIAAKLGVPLENAEIGKFSDGETRVVISGDVRDRDIYVIQPTSAPVNDNLMELILMIDALRESSAGNITAVIPYFGYARQDQCPDDIHAPISAKIVAGMITSAGADQVVTVDLHAGQIQGFFSKPVDHLSAKPVLLSDIKRNYDANITIVSPDAGGMKRARKVAKWLPDANVAMIDKRRPKDNEVEVMNVVGDVSGQTCIIVDDIVDTAGTLCEAAKALKNNGAARVVAYISHPVLSGKAIDKINASCLDELVVTDTIPLSDEAKKCSRIRVIGMADLLAQAIHRIHCGESLTQLIELSCEQAVKVQAVPQAKSPSVYGLSDIFAKKAAARAAEEKPAPVVGIPGLSKSTAA